MKRFYKSVSVAETDGGFGVLLDGKALKTPGHAKLVLPVRALAEAVAEEWRGQGETISPATMTLTKLANTAVERMPQMRGVTVAQILAFGRSDLLCYRADAPAELVSRQAAAWDPLLDWAHARHGARLSIGTGIGFVEQPADALVALEEAIWTHDDLALAGLHAAATLTGSLVLALALTGRRLTAAEAFVASRVDEAYQAEKWGADAEAEARAARHLAELESAEKFIRISRS